MNRLPMIAGITSLIVSSFSLGMSAWAVGCGNATAEEPQDPSPAVVTAQPVTAPAPKPAVDEKLAVVAANNAATKAAPKPVSAGDAREDGQRASAKELRVKRLVVARGVKDREPVAGGPSIPLDGKPVYAFVEVANGSAHTGDLVVTFERGATTRGNVELSVPAGSPRWRTWGMTRGIQTPGAWVAVVRTSSGEELARAPFEVERADSAPKPAPIVPAIEAPAAPKAPANAATEAAPEGTPHA